MSFLEREVQKQWPGPCIKKRKAEKRKKSTATYHVTNKQSCVHLYQDSKQSSLKRKSPLKDKVLPFFLLAPQLLSLPWANRHDEFRHLRGRVAGWGKAQLLALTVPWWIVPLGARPTQEAAASWQKHVPSTAGPPAPALGLPERLGAAGLGERCRPGAAHRLWAAWPRSCVWKAKISPEG